MNESTQTQDGKAHGALAAVAITEMRTPLARVELAASRLRRDAATPANERLAERVSEGVREIDALLDRALRLLVPIAAGHRQLEPLSPVLDSLHRRLAPVLERRGVRWSVASAAVQGREGDARRLRRATLIALQAARSLPREASDPALEVIVDENRCALALSWRSTASDEDAVASEQTALEEVRRLAMAEGVELELWRQGDRPRLGVWLDTCVGCEAKSVVASPPVSE